MFKLLSILSFFFVVNGYSIPFQIDSAHTKIEFKIPYLKVSTVTGSFKKFESMFDYDPAKKELKDVSVTIEATSIDTGIEARDNHLRTPDFFDVQNFPKISFKAPLAIKKGDKIVAIEGEMTLRGITKKQQFKFEINEPIEDMMGVMKYPFKATTVVNRKDFGVAWNKQTKHGTWVIGDDVEVTVEGMAAEIVAKK